MPSRWSIVGLGVGAALAAGSVVAAAPGPIDYSTARLERRLLAVKATTAIELDGRLDEGAWRDAPVAKGSFRTTWTGTSR